MKLPKPKYLVLSLVFLMLTQCSSPDQNIHDEASVRHVSEDFILAWNRHDMKALANLFSEDADFVNVVGMWWKNRQEIELAHVKTHETMFKNSQLSGEVTSLKFIKPDVAVAHLNWKLVGHLAPDGTLGEPRSGILVYVAVKEKDGTWRIHTAQNTDIIPGALSVPQSGSVNK